MTKKRVMERKDTKRLWRPLRMVCGMLSSLCLLQACEHDLPFHVSRVDTKLIMNALLESGRDTNYVLLHLSLPDMTVKLNDASVTLRVNDEVVETGHEVFMVDTAWAVSKYGKDYVEKWMRKESGKKFAFTSSFHPGDCLRLEAVAEQGTYRVWSEVVVPRPLPAFQVDTSWVYVSKKDFHRKMQEYSITVEDIPGEDNYFRMEWCDEFSSRFIVERPGASEWGFPEYEERVYTERLDESDISRDAIMNDGQPIEDEDADFGMLFPFFENTYRVFSDARFRDGTATLKVLTPDYGWHLVGGGSYTRIENTHSVIIRLLSLTKEYYHYLRSLNMMKSDDYDEMLMEPVCLPCNVEGGLGFVGVCSVTTRLFRLPGQITEG